MIPEVARGVSSSPGRRRRSPLVSALALRIPLATVVTGEAAHKLAAGRSVTVGELDLGAAPLRSACVPK
jgi:hypothetical protein